MELYNKYKIEKKRKSINKREEERPKENQDNKNKKNVEEGEQ